MITKEARARVTNRNDPEKRGRLKVTCDALVGSAREVPVWIEPGALFVDKGSGDAGAGEFWLPQVGAEVLLRWNETHESDAIAGESSFLSPNYKWFPSKYTLKKQLHPLPDAFQENYPHRSGRVTATGHFDIYDDSPDSMNRMRSFGHAAGHYVLFWPDGSITLFATDGSTIELRTKEETILLRQANGSAVQLKKDEVDVIAPDGSYISMKAGVMQINALGQVNVTGPLVNLNAAAVLVGAGAGAPEGSGGSSRIARFFELNDYLDDLKTWLEGLQSTPGTLGGPLLSGGSPINTPPGASPVIPSFASQSKVK